MSKKRNFLRAVNRTDPMYIAYLRGQQDARKGKYMTDNPYPLHAKRRRSEWARGHALEVLGLR